MNYSMFDLGQLAYILSLTEDEIEISKISDRMYNLVTRLLNDLDQGVRVRFTKMEFVAFTNYVNEEGISAWAYNVKKCVNGDYIIYKWETEGDL